MCLNLFKKRFIVTHLRGDDDDDVDVDEKGARDNNSSLLQYVFHIFHFGLGSVGCDACTLKQHSSNSALPFSLSLQCTASIPCSCIYCAYL